MLRPPPEGPALWRTYRNHSIPYALPALRRRPFASLRWPYEAGFQALPRGGAEFDFSVHRDLIYRSKRDSLSIVNLLISDDS